MADKHGNVLVLGTRDCSLQRRNQKLVEEAPAPFLSDSSTPIDPRCCEEDPALPPAMSGAGTVEFLLGGDGTISFLEVNTRLQVEHPVTEETTGIDLVHRAVPYRRRPAPARSPRRLSRMAIRSSSVLMPRIQAEASCQRRVQSPSSTLPPGLASGLTAASSHGSTVPGTFDSLIAKLIVTGANSRRGAETRPPRAPTNSRSTALATVLPFHRAAIETKDFTGEGGFKVHTRWIETDFDNRLEAEARPEPVANPPLIRTHVEIDGRRHEIGIPVALLAGLGGLAGQGTGLEIAARVEDTASVATPISGTLQAYKVQDGAEVAAGDLIAVIEAMKMETLVTASRAGKIRITAQAGAYLQAGAEIARFESPPSVR